jgi:hypothetical protein
LLNLFRRKNKGDKSPFRLAGDIQQGIVFAKTLSYQKLEKVADSGKKRISAAGFRAKMSAQLKKKGRLQRLPVSFSFFDIAVKA